MLTVSNIKLLKSLQHKKHRKENNLFVAEGHRLVTDLLVSSIDVKEVYYTESWMQYVPKGDSRFCLVSEKEMSRISGLVTSSPVFAVASIPVYGLNSIDLKNELTLALDGIQDPGNLGTIIRLADWFGIRSIVCSNETADAYSPKVIQATMGAISRVKVHYTVLPIFLNDCATLGMPIYGAFLDGQNIYTANLASAGIVVMGNEGNGISKEVASCVAEKLTIPNFGIDEAKSESLNVAVATAIICSEFQRRTFT